MVSEGKVKGYVEEVGGNDYYLWGRGLGRVGEGMHLLHWTETVICQSPVRHKYTV